MTVSDVLALTTLGKLTEISISLDIYAQHSIGGFFALSRSTLCLCFSPFQWLCFNGIFQPENGNCSHWFKRTF